MKLFNVMIESQDKSGSFLQTLEVAADSSEAAEKLALQWCTRESLHQAKIEEATLAEPQTSVPPGVVDVWGRSYFRP